MAGALGAVAGCSGLQRGAGTLPTSAFHPFRVHLRRSSRPASRRSWPVATLSIPRPGAAVSRSSTQNAAEDFEFPDGHVRYETMIVLRPDMTDEERDSELAKFEAFLSKLGGSNTRAMVRGRQRLAYPISKFWEGIYVLYDYSAPRTASQQVQKYLSTPIAGNELNILRHMTFNR